MSDLLTVTSIGEAPADFVRGAGSVVAEFAHLTQDSGNVSWLVDVGDRRLFVKTAGPDTPPPPGAAVPYFDHAGRVEVLRNAVVVARSCDHPALPRLLNVIESPGGPALVYEAADGELVGVRAAERPDPTSSYQRFAHLPSERLLGVFDVLVDLHTALAAVGWVAVDLYDGCLIVDHGTGSLKVVDLDGYRRGPSRNEMGRMFGSTRFMAPEEFELGAVIDERTTVFTLGRLVWHFATRLTESRSDFCGPAALAEVVQQAVQPSPEDRYAGVAPFAAAWRSARGR
ncbi:serine/threonine protein kinase [Nocardioides cynanchi]|uniref:serine/threonine protein kinase n=1 Tax=Nocardioides cynanchi TaxID=2558918 RepID=UPI0012439EC4|nr:serine/threonine protein kinase [Nocardioides cynanchi]